MKKPRYTLYIVIQLLFSSILSVAFYVVFFLAYVYISSNDIDASLEYITFQLLNPLVFLVLAGFFASLIVALIAWEYKFRRNKNDIFKSICVTFFAYVPTTLIVLLCSIQIKNLVATMTYLILPISGCACLCSLIFAPLLPKTVLESSDSSEEEICKK